MFSKLMAHANITLIIISTLQFLVNSNEIKTELKTPTKTKFSGDWLKTPLGSITYESTIIENESLNYVAKTPFGSLVLDYKMGSSIDSIKLKFEDEVLAYGTFEKSLKKKTTRITAFIPMLQQSKILNFNLRANSLYEMVAQVKVDKIDLNAKIVYKSDFQREYATVKISGGIGAVNSIGSINIGTERFNDCIELASGESINKYEGLKSCEIIIDGAEFNFEKLKFEFNVIHDDVNNEKVGLTKEGRWVTGTTKDGEPEQAIYVGFSKWWARLSKYNSDETKLAEISGSWQDIFSPESSSGSCFAEERICSFYELKLNTFSPFPQQNIIPDQTFYFPSMAHLGSFLKTDLTPFVKPIVNIFSPFLADPLKLVDVLYHYSYFHEKLVEHSSDFSCQSLVRNIGLEFRIAGFNFQNDSSDFCSVEKVEGLLEKLNSVFSQVKTNFDAIKTNEPEFRRILKEELTICRNVTRIK